MKNFWESTIKYAVLIVNFLFALGMPIVKYSIVTYSFLLYSRCFLYRYPDLKGQRREIFHSDLPVFRLAIGSHLPVSTVLLFSQ